MGNEYVSMLLKGGGVIHNVA